MKAFKKFLTEAEHYERITLNDGKRFYLRVSSDSGDFVRGIEVDKEAEEVIPRGKDKDGNAFHQRMRIVQKSEIKNRQRMRLNLIYAMLEPLTEETETETDKPSAKDYITRVRSWGTPWGSGNANRAAVKLGDHVEIDVQTFPVLGPDVVLIQSIESNPSGQGYGTQTLRRIIELADKLSVRLALEPLPFVSRSGKRVPQSKLKTWYASFGFRTLKSEEHGDAYMIRPPKKS